MVHFLEACCIARNATFSAESSVGKSFLCLVALRSTLFNDSMALVV